MQGGGSLQHKFIGFSLQQLRVGVDDTPLSVYRHDVVSVELHGEGQHDGFSAVVSGKGRIPADGNIDLPVVLRSVDGADVRLDFKGTLFPVAMRKPIVGLEPTTYSLRMSCSTN